MVSGVIDKVVAMIILWMSLSISPYLDDVRSGVSEGPARVWSVRSVVLKILAFGVLIGMSSWLAFRCSHLDLFFWFVLRQGPTSSTHCSDGEGL